MHIIINPTKIKYSKKLINLLKILKKECCLCEYRLQLCPQRKLIGRSIAQVRKKRALGASETDEQD